MLERLFKLSQHRTDVATEVVAGLTTFMAMAYILLVNPSILGLAGIPQDAVFFATAVGAGLATLAMGLFVNYPLALAPGMGLNAFYTFTVVMGMHVPWQTALGAVFISGLIFILLTATQIRQLIVVAIPDSLKRAITVGIGLFITLIGLKISGIMTIGLSLTPETLKAVTAAHGNGVPAFFETNIQLGNLRSPETLLAIIGLLIIGVLLARKVRGAILIGIVATALLGIPMHVTNTQNFSLIRIPSFANLAVGKLDILGALHMGILTVIFTFTFVELFDSLGTIVGTAQKAGIMDASGRFPRIGKALMVDAFSVSGGALLGTSTITAYIESATGIAAGGKTGLTAVVVGILFLLSVLFAPVAGLIPDAATAPALIIVGALMMTAVRGIDFEDFSDALPAFLTIVLMPFTYSIATGVAAGLILFPLTKAVTGRAKEVHWLMWVLALVVIARFLFLNA